MAYPETVSIGGEDNAKLMVHERIECLSRVRGGDVANDMLQVGVGLNTVRLCALNQCEHGSAGLGAVRAITEQPGATSALETYTGVNLRSITLNG